MAPRVTNADLKDILDEVKEELKDMNGRQRTDHDDITVLKQKLTTSARVQGVLTLVGSAIAAGIGININR